MPTSAPRPCRAHGCGQLTTLDGRGYCALHLQQARQVEDQQRGSSSSRGYGRAWQKARLGYLRSHPLCVRCQAKGEVEAATVVDHRLPHRGDRVLFWDTDNWQSLCKPCHDAKTATEDGGFGRVTRSFEKAMERVRDPRAICAVETTSAAELVAGLARARADRGG